MSKKSKYGYLQVGVETYGGGIWHSWFDRDLSLAGRVVLASKDGSFNSKLIKIDRPLLRIPTLAIHCEWHALVESTRTQIDTSNLCSVDRGVNEGFKFNRETEFTPILGLVAAELNGTKDDTKQDDPSATKAAEASSIQNNHHPALLELIASELSVAPTEIHDFEL